VGLYAILQGNLKASANYQISFTNGQFEVHPKPFETPIIPESPVIVETPSFIVAPPIIRNDLPLSGLSGCTNDPETQGGSANCEPASAGGGAS
jgi:hypothetical protein